MPITISYDLRTDDANKRTYVRSMLERFHWRRLGGSVFRYEGAKRTDGSLEEDWLNHVAPALMFMRSYALKNQIIFKFFTLDAASITFLDHSDSATVLGKQPLTGADLDLAAPTNVQSSEQVIRDFIDSARDAAGGNVAVQPASTPHQ